MTELPGRTPSTGPAQVLEVGGLTVRIDGRPVVREVSLSIGQGEVLALVGESGSGKTLTARSILGLLPAGAVASGSIRLPAVAEGDADLLAADDRRWRRLRGRAASMVFQEPQSALNPVRTIGWQLAEALRARHTGADRIPRQQLRSRAAELLRMVELPDTRRLLRSYPHQLSGGQKQRVVIAIALAGRPALLIADEPTTALDVTVQQEILRLLSRLREQLGTAILLITHNLGVVAELADRVLVLRNGRPVESGPVPSVFADPQHDYTRSLLAAVPRLSATAAAPPAPDLTADSPTADKPVIWDAAFQLINASVSFPGRFGRPDFLALDAVSVDLGRGSVLGVVGESGSGKSTLGRTASCVAPLATGRVLVGGEELTRRPAERLRRIRRTIGVVQQDPGGTLNPRLTVAEAVAEPLRVHRACPRREVDRRVSALLDQVSLPAGTGNRLPGELSGGQRQRVALARALILRPELLIADEPTSALDVSVQARVLDLFRALQSELGFACVFISHDLAVVDQVSDQLLVLRGGRVVEQGPTRRVLTRPQAEYTRLLRDAVPDLDAAGPVAVA